MFLTFSSISQIKYVNFQRNERKKLEKILHTMYNSVIFVLSTIILTQDLSFKGTNVSRLSSLFVESRLSNASLSLDLIAAHYMICFFNSLFYVG